MAKAKEWKPKRVRSEDERGSGSSEYISLDEGENFLAYALFDADPALEDPAYYEYVEHWHNASRKSIPCAGEDCPLCEDGDRPKTRAKTLWLVVRDERKKDLSSKEAKGELRIFNLNYNLIKMFTEMRGEGDKIKGRQFRVGRVDDRGTYNLMPKDEKLTASEIKELVKSKDAPDFDAIVTAQLRRAMEGLTVARAMDDDDNDSEPEEEEKKSSKKGAGKKSKKADWPDSLDDEVVTVSSVDDEGNFVTVESDDYDGEMNVYTTEGIEFDLTDLKEGAVISVTTGEQDSDGDYILTEDPKVAGEEAAEEEGTEDEKPDKIVGEEFEITEIDGDNSTWEVKSDDLGLAFTLYFLDKGPASKVDFEDYAVGNKVKVTCEKDSVNDMVATEIPELVKAGAKKGGKKAPAKKGAKGK